MRNTLFLLFGLSNLLPIILWLEIDELTIMLSKTDSHFHLVSSSFHILWYVDNTYVSLLWNENKILRIIIGFVSLLHLLRIIQPDSRTSQTSIKDELVWTIQATWSLPIKWPRWIHSTLTMVVSSHP